MTIFSPDGWRVPRWLLVFCMVFSLGLHANPARSETEPQLTRKQLNADLSNAYELLKKIHPNFTAHKSAKELKALRDRLITSSADTNSLDDAYLKLTELIGAVCDEHTYIVKSKRDFERVPGGWPWFTKPLVIHDGTLYAELNSKDGKVEVLEINGIEGSFIASEIVRRMPFDGCYQNGTFFVFDSLTAAGHIFNAVVGNPKIYRMKYRDSQDSAPKELDIESLKLYVNTTISKWFYRTRWQNINLGYSTHKFFHRLLDPSMGNANLDYYFSIPRNLAYLRVGNFKPISESREGIELVMRDIVTKNPDALVLDVTGSPGGNSGTVQFMLAFLLPRAHRLSSEVIFKNISRKPPSHFEFNDDQAMNARKENVRFFRKIRSRNGIRRAPMSMNSFGKPDYKGKIYVLVGPRSHSNAIKVASNLKRLRNATIVGNVTASNVKKTCAQAYGSVRLEHSGFLLYIPELCYRSPENAVDGQSALKLDIPVDILNQPTTRVETKILQVALDHYDQSREIARDTASAD